MWGPSIPGQVCSPRKCLRISSFAPRGSPTACRACPVCDPELAGEYGMLLAMLFVTNGLQLDMSDSQVEMYAPVIPAPRATPD